MDGTDTESGGAALEALLYVSSAVGQPTVDELTYLLKRARARNGHFGVTGLLLYNDLNFMQYIEGPSEPLARIYSIICDDPLHQNVTELWREAVSARMFPGWQMAFRSAAEPVEPPAPGVEDLLVRPWPPSSHPAAKPHGLLRNFWRRRRPKS